MMHKVVRARRHCEECNDTTYIPPRVSALFDGRQELKTSSFDTFEGLQVTPSALEALKSEQSLGGHRWHRIVALLRTLEQEQPDAVTHRANTDPDVRETYIKRIGNELGIRIYWTAAPAMTVVAVEPYPHSLST